MKRKFNGELAIVGRSYQTSINSNRVHLKLAVYVTIFVTLSQSLKILPKPCSNALGEQGTCMFVWECIKTEGKHLGTCVDGFLFGSCCTHNETLNQVDSGGSTPMKLYYPHSVSAAYHSHSEHELSTTNLDLVRDHSSSSNLTSYVNFNNNPPSDNDVYHIHDTSNSPSVHSTTPSSSNYHLNHPTNHYVHSNHHSNKPTNGGHLSIHNFNNFDDNDDHRRPHTHGHNHSNHAGTHSHHHNYENFHHSNSDKQTAKPNLHSFINFNLTNQNHHLTNRPTYKPTNYHTTTILPPNVMNYNPFKPANHSSNPFLINKKNSTSTSGSSIGSIKPANSTFQSNKPTSTNTQSSSAWNSFYKPWSNKPSNGQLWSIHTFTTKPSNSFLQTFRPPLFSIFRPHSPSTVINENQSNSIQPTLSSLSNMNPFYNKPTFRPPVVRPTVSSFASNVQPYYSTSITPFLSNTQSIGYQTVTQSSGSIVTTTTTTTEPPFLISPNMANGSFVFQEIKPLSGSYQNMSNVSYLTNESSSVVVTNGDPTNNSGESNQLQSAPATSMRLPESRANCGSPKIMPNTKVVGGRSATFGAWPWQVSVRRTSFFGFSSTHRCGGAILSANWIATAAHCIDDLLMSHIRIRVGEYDFASVLEPFPYQERTVKRKVVHPLYNFFTYENDLALVELEEPLIFQPHIAPICLPEETVGTLLGRNATVTGWGRLSEGGILPSVLQEVRVPIVSNEKCKSMFSNAGRQEYIPDVFLCAGFEDGGHDSCQGDSGGPLQVKGDDGRWFLAGIISWGIGCAEKNLPGVCTRINKFVSWIHSTMRNPLDQTRY